MTRKATRQLVTRSGFALRFHTALHGETTEAFARRIDKPLRTVMRWRNGESEPRGEDLALICRATGHGHDYFYPGPSPEEVAA